jgi:hypothetical protein
MGCGTNAQTGKSVSLPCREPAFLLARAGSTCGVFCDGDRPMGEDTRAERVVGAP